MGVATIRRWSVVPTGCRGRRGNGNEGEEGSCRRLIGSRSWKNRVRYGDSVTEG